MKKITSTALICIITLGVFSQTKNEYSLGYGKYFLDGLTMNNHYLFWQYAHLTKVKHLSWSVRGAFYFEEYPYNPPIPGKMNYIAVPGVDFPMEGIIEHDPTTTGIKQLSYMNGKFTDFRFSTMAKYKFGYLKCLFTSLYAGVGMEYTYDHGLMDGDFFDFKDSAFPQGEGVIFFENYYSGLDFFITHVLQTGISVGDKLDLGLEIKMDYYFTGGFSLFTNSFFINFKF